MADSKRFLTKADAARHFGVSKPLITRKFQQGKLVMVGDLIDVVESAGAFGGNGKPVGIVNSAVNTADVDETTGAVETYADAQRRKESALANLRELEHRQKLGDLVDVSVEERAWAEAGQTLRDGLLAMPEKIAPILAALTDARQVRDALKAEIRSVLENLTEKIGNVSDQKAA